MPALGMAQESGVLIRWLVPEGGAVVEGDPLMEVETDKAVVEVPATASGTLAAVAYGEGAELAVGTVLAVLLGPGESLGSRSRSSAGAVAGRADAAVGAGATAPAVAVPAAAAVEPVSASAAAVVGSAGVAANDRAVANAGAVASDRAVVGTRAVVLASPKAKRLARERGIDLATVRGSGPAGAVRSIDLATAAAVAETAATTGPTSVPTSVPTSAPAAPVATIAAQEEAWLRTTADLAGLSEFVERVSRSSLAPADAAIVNADVLTRAVVAGLRQRTVLGPVEVTVHLTVYDAGGRSTTVTLAADQLGSIVSVSDARKRLAAGTDAAGRASQPGPTSDQPGGPISQPGPSAPVRVAIVDLSAERLERSPTLRYADTPIRLTLGPAVVPATIGGREAHATGEAQLLLEYDHSVLDDERAATLIYHVSRLVADPFALAVQG